MCLAGVTGDPQGDGWGLAQVGPCSNLGPRLIWAHVKVGTAQFGPGSIWARPKLGMAQIGPSRFGIQNFRIPNEPRLVV